MRRALLLALVAGLSSCTVIDVARVPDPKDPKAPFLTAGDLSDPHEVLGMVQATRSGVLLFGFVDVMGTDLETGFHEVLSPQIKSMGGDGAVRVRFRRTQYAPWAQVLGAIFFFVPLPTEVTMTAQVVKLRNGASAPVAPAPPTSL